VSDHQAPGAGREENQTSVDLELLRLRGAISDIAISEGRLKTQEGQLHVWVARFRGEAQDHLDTALAARAQQQLATLQPQLTSVQEQLARLQAEKAALTRQQQALLEKLNIFSVEQAQTLTSADSGIAWSPAPPVRQPGRPGRQRLVSRPLFWFSALLAALVIVLAVVSAHPFFFSPVPRATSVVQAPTPTPTPPPAPIFTPNGTGPSDLACLDATSIDCYSPEQVQEAFSLNSLYRSDFNGKGQTIVILGAGHTTDLQVDLHHFDQTWGLPDPVFQILQPHGPPAPYQCADGVDDLQLESTLDIEWSHAIAPGAKLVLVIGDNNSGGSLADNCFHDSLLDDVTYTLDHHLGTIISISYGGSELGDVSETAGEHAQDQDYYRNADSIFQRAAREHVTVLASAGDQGATNPNDFTKSDSYWNRPNIAWPASDPYVLAVGGTSLTIANNAGAYNSEAVWNDAGFAATGGGLSLVFPEPAYQKQVSDQTIFHGKRGIPDVAFPAEAFVMYTSLVSGFIGKANPQFTHWDLAGGTSLSAPCWAGLIAIADQMNQHPLGFIQPALYWLNGQGMHDITVGDNSFANVLGYQAQPGYDLASGWGTPIADEFIPALLQATLDISPGCKHYPRQCTWKPQPT
jgi:hypothetical protein